MLSLRPEVIGPPECPILYRWTLVGRRKEHDDESAHPPSFKLLLHRFLPNADDRAVHDHPRPFWTFVLHGQYDDLVPCSLCESRERGDGATCSWCLNGLVVGDRMTPGTLRYRPARHRHRTCVGPRGCWTLVLMGPLRQRWGFFHAGRKWPWREFERRFGFGMRCGDEDREG